MAELMCRDPRQGIRRLPEFMERIRDVNSDRAFVEAVAGGPNPHWTGSLLDVLSMIYPEVDRDLQVEALTTCLYFLDRQNYFTSQENVELIKDPWLVRDIIINFSLYWPGFQKYVDLLEANRDIASFKKALGKVQNGVWMAWAVIHSDFASLPVRKWYYENFPELIDHTLDAIAGITFDHAEHDWENKKIPIEEGIEKRIKKYDPFLHRAIHQKVSERKWIKIKRSWQA